MGRSLPRPLVLARCLVSVGFLEINRPREPRIPAQKGKEVSWESRIRLGTTMAALLLLLLFRSPRLHAVQVLSSHGACLRPTALIMMTFAVVALGMAVALLAFTAMAFAVACPSLGVIASH